MYVLYVCIYFQQPSAGAVHKEKKTNSLSEFSSISGLYYYFSKSQSHCFYSFCTALYVSRLGQITLKIACRRSIIPSARHTEMISQTN